MITMPNLKPVSSANVIQVILHFTLFALFFTMIYRLMKDFIMVDSPVAYALVGFLMNRPYKFIWKLSRKIVHGGE